MTDTIALVESAHRRRDETGRKVWEAMARIDAEMAANGGVYPSNRGKVTLSEVFARAGVGRSTMGEPHHKGLIAEVKAWLGKKRKSGAVTRRDALARQRGAIEDLSTEVSRLAADAQAWAARCEEAEREQARSAERIADLEAEIMRLRAEAAPTTKVTPIRRKPSDA